jgi:hypothetical protein
MFKTIAILIIKTDTSIVQVIGSFADSFAKIKQSLLDEVSLSDNEKITLIAPLLFVYKGPLIKMFLSNTPGLSSALVDDAITYVNKNKEELKLRIQVPSVLLKKDSKICDEKKASNSNHPIYQQFQHVLSQMTVDENSCDRFFKSMLLVDAFYENSEYPLQTSTERYFPFTVSINPKSTLLLNLLVSGQFSTIDSFSDKKMPGFGDEEILKIKPGNVSTLHLLTTISQYVPADVKVNMNKAILYLIDKSTSLAAEKADPFPVQMLDTTYTLISPMNSTFLSQITDKSFFIEVLEKVADLEKLDHISFYDGGSTFSGSLSIINKVIKAFKLSDTHKVLLLAPLFSHYSIDGFDHESVAIKMGISKPLISEIKQYLLNKGSYLIDTQPRNFQLDDLPSDPELYLESVKCARKYDELDWFFDAYEAVDLSIVKAYKRTQTSGSAWTLNHLSELVEIVITEFLKQDEEIQSEFQDLFSNSFLLNLNKPAPLMKIMSLFLSPAEYLTSLMASQHFKEYLSLAKSFLKESETSLEQIKSARENILNNSLTKKEITLRLKNLSVLEDYIVGQSQIEAPVLPKPTNKSKSRKKNKKVKVEPSQSEQINTEPIITKNVITKSLFSDMLIDRPTHEEMKASNYRTDVLTRLGTITVSWDLQGTLRKSALFMFNNEDAVHEIKLKINWPLSDAEEFVSHDFYDKTEVDAK